MDIAITGASGLVGTALVERLAADGHRVRRLVRRAGAGADEVAWDPAAGTLDVAALEGVDGVVHLAGAGIGDRRWTDDRKRVIRDSRIDGTTLLADALATLERPPSVLVSGSAIGYYGDRGDEVLTEDRGPGDDFVARLCVDWEAATGTAAAAGIRTVVVRTGLVLSAHGGLLGRLLLPFRLGIGGRLGSGHQYMSWISIDDEVGVIVRALTDGALEGPVNATAPNPVTNREFTATLGRVLRRPTLIPTPTFALRLLFGGEAVETAFLASQRVRPARLEALGHEFVHPELEGALRAALARPAP